MTIQPVLRTTRVSRLVTFYKHTFKASEIARFPAEGVAFYVGLRLGRTSLAIVNEDSGAERDAPQRMHLDVVVTDLDGVLPRLIEEGGRVLTGPEDTPWRMRVLQASDPDGNVLMVNEELPPATSRPARRTWIG